MLYFVLSHPTDMEVILYIPGKHQDITKKLFEEPGFAINIQTATHPLPKEGNTDFLIESKQQDQFAQLTLIKEGADFYTSLKRKVFKLAQEKIDTIFLQIPAWETLNENIEEELNKLGFFFTGFSAKTPQEWYINYTNLRNQIIDFDRINIHDEMAKELKDYIREQYLAVIP